MNSMLNMKSNKIPKFIFGWVGGAAHLIASMNTIKNWVFQNLYFLASLSYFLPASLFKGRGFEKEQLTHVVQY